MPLFYMMRKMLHQEHQPEDQFPHSGGLGLQDRGLQPEPGQGQALELITLLALLLVEGQQ